MKMRNLKLVLFILGFVTISIHCVRLVYLVFLESRSSVLHEYEEPVEAEIRESRDLGELLRLYEEAHARVEAYERDESIEEPSPPSGISDQHGISDQQRQMQRQLQRHIARRRLDAERSETEPYKSEIALRKAIQDWEGKSREISKLRFYWLFGFVFLVLGCSAYRWLDEWLGISGIIVAFSEMIFWASPVYLTVISSREFERLLHNKLVLALITFALLVAAFWMTEIAGRTKESTD